MNRFLLLILGSLCFLMCGCGEREEEPVDIDRMVKSGEEELPEWTAHIDDKLITDEPYPQETIVPEGREMAPQ